MFNRFESFKKAIVDKSIDFNTLQLMIDFHVQKGTLTEEEGQELFSLMYPPEESEEENET
ncbi:hypothetical protein V6C42_13030 [Pseudoclostridium thermosuccinogenes]|uniref:hypothetical protein n=1 Tax=Clostridium thermosuccinogenes TaxID=84032 RepID=UPI002FDB40F9